MNVAVANDFRNISALFYNPSESSSAIPSIEDGKLKLKTMEVEKGHLV